MTHRPWRIEYLNAESDWTLTRHTFATLEDAEAALPNIEDDQPGVTFRIVRHPDWELTTR